MAEGGRHWVEDLFPPVYGLTDEDLFGETKSKPLSVYELAAKRITQYDPDTIKNVYERVWLLKTLEEEERRSRGEEGGKKDQEFPARGSAAAQQGVIGNQTADTSAKSKVKGGFSSITTDTDDPQPDLPSDITDSSIWNSEELAELRKVFSAARRENVRLKAQLANVEERVKEVEEIAKENTALLEFKDKSLLEAEKANKRLVVLTKSLKAELSDAEKQNQELRDDLQVMIDQNKEMQTQLSGIQKVASADRIRRENLESDLKHSHQVVKRNAELIAEQMDARHMMQTAMLEQQLVAVNKELEEEKQSHERSCRALKLLQNHFASAAVPKDLREKPTLVTQSELKKWSY